MKEFKTDDLLFVLAKSNEDGAYEFYYHSEDDVYRAADAIVQIIKDLRAEKAADTADNAENDADNSKNDNRTN